MASKQPMDEMTPREAVSAACIYMRNRLEHARPRSRQRDHYARIVSGLNRAANILLAFENIGEGVTEDEIRGGVPLTPPDELMLKRIRNQGATDD